MILNSNGILLNGVADVQISSLFTGSIAIIDTDGSCIQIPETELLKIIDKYRNLKSMKPVNPKPAPP